MSFKKKLEKMQGSYEDASESAFAEVPSGTYLAKLQNVEITEAKSSEALQIHREHVILDGEQEEKVVHDWQGIGSPDKPNDVGLSIIKAWLKVIGFDIPKKAHKLEPLMEEITEAAPTVKVRVSHREGSDFPNVRVLSLEEEGEGGEEEGGDVEFEVGDRVIYTDDDKEEFPGEITELNAGDDEDLITVHFDDGDDGNISPGDLTKEEAEDEGKGEDEGFSKGDRVIYKDGDGDTFPGKITEVMDDDTYKVKFDDGDDGTIDADDLTAGEEAKAKGKGKGKAKADDDKPETELLDFCQSQDINVDDDDNRDDVIAKINESRWDKKYLTKKEIKKLEEIDAEFVKETKGKGKAKGKEKASKGKAKGKGAGKAKGKK